MKNYAKASACLIAMIFLFGTLLFPAITLAQGSAESTSTVTITVTDGVTHKAALGVTTYVYSSSGALVQNLGTVPQGGTTVSLPSGQYNVEVKIGIFGFPVTLGSFSFTNPQVTAVEITVSAYFIPIQYLPLLIYIAVVIIILVIIIAIILRLLRPSKKTVAAAEGGVVAGAAGGAAGAAVAKPCSIETEGGVWQPPARPIDPNTGKPCSIVEKGAVWKPAEPPKDPATGKP
jgi:hypothetical protein